MNPGIAPVMTLIITALVGVAPAAFAQEEQGALPQEILACAGESDVMLRLSCYDREVAAFRNRPLSAPIATPPVAVAVRGAVAAHVATVVAATVVAATPAVGAADPAPEAVAVAPARATSSMDNFGFDAPMDEITSDVARIRKRPYGELIIYLENGQIWEQKHLDRRFRLKNGESVTISKSVIAGYRLSGNSNRSIQVQRLN